MDTIGGLFMIIGAVFVLLAGVGVVRFPDLFSRLHAGAKGPTLGVLCIGLGAALSIRTVQAVVAVVLVIVLQFIAGPVGSHLIGRASYRMLRPPLDGPDELADS